MKIAVLYIATGRYTVFWRDFYLSAQRYFIPDAQKDYFMFTDNEHVDFENNENVYKIYQPKLGWPYDTMMRFEMFLTQVEKLKSYDYIFFFNANLLFVSPIGNEVLPSKEQDGLVVCKHPGAYNKPVEKFTYERNPLSTSYVSPDEGKYYVQGALIGGMSEDFLTMCRWCNEKLHKDLDNNIIPVWHDESILNKYILNKKPLVLECNYLYPENGDVPEFRHTKKIIIRDKSDPKYGGHDYLRGISDFKGGKRAKRRRKFSLFGIKFSIKI